MIDSSTIRRASAVPAPSTGAVGVSPQQVGSEDQLDRQQILEQTKHRVGLADTQRCRGAVVLDAEVQRRSVQSGRHSELFELRRTPLRPDIAIAAHTAGMSAGRSFVACIHPRDGRVRRSLSCPT